MLTEDNQMAVEIFWTLFASTPDRAPVEDFLSPTELEIYHGLRVPKRQAEWLAGRLAAKYLLLQTSSNEGKLTPQSITVKNDPNGAPYFVFQDKLRLPGCLSISHSHHLALCGLTLEPGVRIGFDLEKVEPRFPGLVQDFFTPAEVQSLSRFEPSQQDLYITLIWSAKEAMLKALGQGLRMDTRKVEITLSTAGEEQFMDGWRTLYGKVYGSEPGSWSIFWQQQDGFILTAAILFPATPREVNLIQKL